MLSARWAIAESSSPMADALKAIQPGLNEQILAAMRPRSEQIQEAMKPLSAQIQQAMQPQLKGLNLR